MANLERFSKMKSMPESGEVTKEQSESQKNIPFPRPVIHPSDTLETRWTNLKSVHDSGAITDAEYKQEKRALLSEV